MSGQPEKEDGHRYFKRQNDAGVYAYTQDQIDLGLAEDAVELSPEETELHLNPPPGYQQLLYVLNSVYQLDVDKFNKSFATAYLSDGPSQEAKQATIRAQYQQRKTKYAEDVLALKTQFGIGV